MSRLADSPGVYKGFSGKIEYKSIYCEVRNASFEILRTKKRFKNRNSISIVFKSGTVISGNLSWADIEHCIFQGKSLRYSVFRGGIFSGEMFHSSYWLGGEWRGDKWAFSYDKFGRTRANPPTEWGNETSQSSGVADSEGTYKRFSGEIKWGDNHLKVKDAFFDLGNFNYYSGAVGKYICFHDGTVLDGKAVDIEVNYCIWKNGVWGLGNGDGNEWRDGTWEDGTWEFGFWENGTFKGGIWKEGVFSGGIFDGGTWEGGDWEDGVWKSGIWESGYDDNGDWHDEGDSPDNWDV